MADDTKGQGEQDIEKSLKEYQMLQEQLRSASLQLEQLQMQGSELNTAKSEVEKATGKIYLSVGGVMVETSKEEALKDIADKQELTNLRIQSATKQLNELKSKEKQLTDKIKELSGAH